ncbi:MAG TPA: hypothetical protein VH080_08285 [Gemmatimonadaceae bacterium]|jgi:hypothetical protein|nr:hypothetical protein [Gemmatimonadaceae bacterium]
MKRKRPRDSERDEMESLVRAALRNYHAMKDSFMVLTIFSADYQKDPVALMQFALAILLDKPIYLAVPNDRPIPANVRAVAAGIEVYERDNMDDFKRASEALMKRATQGH